MQPAWHVCAQAPLKAQAVNVAHFHIAVHYTPRMALASAFGVATGVTPGSVVAGVTSLPWSVDAARVARLRVGLTKRNTDVRPFEAKHPPYTSNGARLCFHLRIRGDVRAGHSRADAGTLSGIHRTGARAGRLA